jgi:serine/threonine protein kinase, bacterial
MPLRDGELFAGYRILRLLGSGGMGEVYLAQHPRLPRRDAIKVLSAEMSASAEFRARFLREADLAATLYHPHIVGVHDRGEFEGQLWISMDYIDGTDADRLLRDHYPAGLPWRELTAIVSAVADALDYAHDRGLLHRDVKPANILLTAPETRHQRILLADFGIARSLTDSSTVTQTNMTVGTLSYAAPEQLTGQPLDGRADQYALAATAFHLLTGSAPLGTAWPDLAGLEPVFATAMANDPNQRYRRCDEFARALAGYATNPPPAPAPTEPTIPAIAVPPRSTSVMPAEPQPEIAAPPPQRSGSWRPAAVGVVIAVLFTAAVLLVWRPWRSDETSGTAVTTTATTTTATTSTTTTTSAITFAGMRDFVTAYYGLLPGRAQEAWTRLAPQYQNQAGQRDYLAFWAGLQSVSLLSVSPRDRSSVVVRLRYTRPDGSTDTEDRSVSVVLAGGQMLISDSQRIGAA